MSSSPQEAGSRAKAPTKGQRTREHIYGCALELFMDRGYEQTTMRMIADRAEVNVALSYHYFPSKEHLVFEFYRAFTDEFLRRTTSALEHSSKLETRLVEVVETMFATAGPYHAFAGSLFATAASPASPLNPFSASFAEVRTRGIALYARVIDGCTPRVPEDLAAELPFLLWVFSLAMLYCWMHDHSEQQRKARTLVRRSARLLAGLLRVSSSPGARYFRRQLLAITRLVRSGIPVSG